MQHLDEGTIHAWLDGALSVEEAKAVEAHAAECEQCAAAVAEARGFIAASSRILTALDDAPRGVIPIRPAVRSRFTPAWRAAAAVLVVALGSVAIRNALKVSDSRVASDSRAARPVALDSVSPETGQSTAARMENSATAQTGAPMVLMPPKPQAKKIAVAPPAQAPAPLRERSDQTLSSAAPVAAPAQGKAEGMLADAPASAMNKVAAAAEDCAGCETQPLRVIRVDSTRSEKRTVYMVSPNEVVTLVEVDTTAAIPGLTGVTATAMSAQGAAKTMDARRVAAASPRANVATPAAPPPPAAQVGAFAMQEQTIEWKDPATGRVLRLTGRLPAERLQEIRKRIEREREAKKRR